MRMIAWASLLPALVRLVPLATLAPRLWQEPFGDETGRADRVVALALAIYGRRRPLRDNCLARSLLTYHFLSPASASVSLVVGVRRGFAGVDGHVWVTLEDRPVHESLVSLAEFHPVVVFGLGGCADYGDD